MKHLRPPSPKGPVAEITSPKCPKHKSEWLTRLLTPIMLAFRQLLLIWPHFMTETWFSEGFHIYSGISGAARKNQEMKRTMVVTWKFCSEPDKVWPSRTCFSGSDSRPLIDFWASLGKIHSSAHQSYAKILTLLITYITKTRRTFCT